jgi:ABC-type multidrug transport system fused ATPase/permease subunit
VGAGAGEVLGGQCGHGEAAHISKEEEEAHQSVMDRVFSFFSYFSFSLKLFVNIFYCVHVFFIDIYLLSFRFAEQKDATKKLKEAMKSLQSEMEIQEQVLEVVERNMIVAEQKAAQEEEEAAVAIAEVEYVKERVESEKEKAKMLEEEESALRDAISRAQTLERKLQKDSMLSLSLSLSVSLSLVYILGSLLNNSFFAIVWNFNHLYFTYILLLHI